MDATGISKQDTIPLYRDKWVIGIGVPLITLFMQYLTYEQIRLNGLLLYELGSDALKVYLVWKVIRWVIQELDQRFSWQRSFTGRLLVQIGLTWLIGCLVLTALEFLDYWLVRPYPNEKYFSYDLVLASIFILLVNAIYVGLYFYHVSTHLEKRAYISTEETHPVPDPSPATLLVRLGKREVLIIQSDILCVFAEEKLTYLLTQQDRVFPLESSLDKVSTHLSEAQFFRINRKYIIAVPLIEQVQAESNGTLQIQLKTHPRIPQTLIVSRARVSAFRQWLRAYHSSVK